jgi:predicted HicB family RNase H-like nuclease
MSSRDHFTYRVQWSPEDQGFVGTVAEFPSLSWISEDPRAAFDGIRDAVAEVLADMAETGETPPTPFTERSFSGKFIVRIPPEAHRSLAIEAAEQNISLNRLAAHRLAGA